MKKFLMILLTWWRYPTLGTLLETWRHGVRVGEDSAGNVYYRNAQDTRRWVIYAAENEASLAPPEWDMWLRKTLRLPPSESPLPRQAWEREWRPNPTGTPAAHTPSGALSDGGVRARATGDYQPWDAASQDATDRRV